MFRRRSAPACRAAAALALLAIACGCLAQSRTPSSNLAALSKSLANASPRADDTTTAAAKSKAYDFSKADCKKLTDAELQRYIDPRVVGASRRTAERYMLAQPPCHRENVEGIDRIPYSNVWEGLVEVAKEYNAWHRLPDGQYEDSSGDVITPTKP